MTGIDRLRAIAGAWDEWGLGGTLAEMADQIERELSEERDRWDDDLSEAQVAWNRVAAVMLDMERHFLGHEGMEDSPVARWARELRDALKSYTSDGRDTQNPSCADPDGAADVTSEAAEVTRDPAEDVSMSAYDLLPSDERDALAWVREHGGLDHVKAEWRSRVPYDRYQRRRQRLLGHIAECETALGRRNERIEELTHRVSDLTRENAELRKRAMPDDYQWPRYESGEPVMFGGFAADVFGTALDEPIVSVELFENGFILHGDSVQAFYGYEERVKRPDVLAADGEPLEVGQTVWTLDNPIFECGVIGFGNGMVHLKSEADHLLQREPSDLTHQRPVLDADGVPIREWDTVWDVESGTEFDVLDVYGVAVDEDFPDHTVRCRRAGAEDYESTMCTPSRLTHTKPEPPDSRRAIVNEIGDEMAARIDLLVSSGRWSDAN